MTDYRLPEGMTADRLRELAEDMAHRGGWSIDAEEVSAWADAIDPSPSIVTDEMVSTYAVERWGNDTKPNDSDRRDLEAVERLGWLDGALVHSALMDELERMGADPDLCWDEALGVMTERLAMAEGLLRRVTIEAMVWEATGGVPVNGGGWWVGSKDWPNESHKVNVTADEAEYLRSLDGEGDGDE